MHLPLFSIKGSEDMDEFTSFLLGLFVGASVSMVGSSYLIGRFLSKIHELNKEERKNDEVK